MNDLILETPWKTREHFKQNKFALYFGVNKQIPEWLVKSVSFLDNKRIKIELFSYITKEEILKLSEFNENIYLNILDRTGVIILVGTICGFKTENIFPKNFDYSSDSGVEFICDGKYEVITWENK
jgi:hypothetical protein